MRAGLTYDLADDYRALGLGDEETAELDSIETVEAIETVLRNLGFETERIGNIKSLVTALEGGRRWDIVFNIAEGINGPGREAQVPALLDAYCIPYTFSDPVVLALTLHKGMTKHIMTARGIPTAEFAVVESGQDLSAVSLGFPLFLKPVGEGTGKGISAASIVSDRASMMKVGNDLLDRFRQPVLVEHYLPGREFTVGVVGTGSGAEALSVMEIIFQKSAECDAYTLWNKKHYTQAVQYRLIEDERAEEYKSLALKAWRCLGCRDGGRVDIRLDEAGLPFVMEINPLPGLHPVDSDLPIICRLSGLDYRWLIEKIMNSALERIRDPRPSRRTV
ncbi:MAG: ATP-grasp domain-containing protein [Spirochaetes bacterium]|nr:ATP-grasp domain-containing protein [Spirochaetota bacterium]